MAPFDINRVTSVSKYISAALFVILPLVGGYIGYKLAAEEIIQAEFWESSEEMVDGLPDGDEKESSGSEIVEEQSDLTLNMYLSDVTIAGVRYTTVDVSSNVTGGVSEVYKQVPYPNGHVEYEHIFSSSGLPETMRNISLGSFSKTGEAVFFGYMSCFECGPHGKTQSAVAKLNDKEYRYQNGGVNQVQNLGYVALFEWLEGNSYRYKLWPETPHPEAKYVNEDRNSPGVYCGMQGCEVDNIDWSTIGWQYGEI